MIEINNLTGFKADKKSFSQVAKKVLKGENKRNTCLSEGREALSLAFVSKTEMQKLNKKYRGKNKPTDVLSFSGINEIVICPEIVKENAKKYGTSAKDEIMKVFVHGILHLCGYDHEKSEKEARKMGEKEEFYLKIKN
ncbi:MAG: rRNA maturation RNase YbeY [Candidatus Staskawiczbacteria bacterium]|nr:rRNA maturation RNase YbeY [Candidatus Staskawiczbacteria bacterium]